MAAQHDALVTLEENAIMGGTGGGVNEVLMAHRKPVPVLNIGLPDLFIPQRHGKKPARNWGSTPQALKPKSRPGRHNPLFAPAMLEE